LSNDLLTIDIPIYDHHSCARAYEKLKVEVFNTTVCAGVASGALDTCNGDSGGPLVCNNTLTGIVSFGNECAVANFPGIYTKISNYLDYIDDPASFNGTFVTYCVNSATKKPSLMWILVIFMFVFIMEL
jgi:trypsin